MAHTPIPAPPSFSNASQLWSWCPTQRGFHHEESRWGEEMHRSPGQAHSPCAQCRSTNQAPAVWGSCSSLGSVSAVMMLQTSIFLDPQGHPAGPSDPHGKLL